MTDVVLIHPNGVHGIYGPLGDTLVSREQPLWPRLIAGYLLDRSVDVKIIDAECEELSPKRVADLVAGYDPKLVCLVVSGHQPSASTQAMPGAREVAEEISKLSAVSGVFYKVMFMGNHPSALPVQTLTEEPCDFVCDGEGPLTIMGLLNDDALETIPGLVWWQDGANAVQNPRAPLLDVNADLHGRAWHLLPAPARYRSHSWQRLHDQSKRSPYAAIHTSLGCPFTCLAGDTSINTVYGDIPIGELVRTGVKEIPVFTYDRGTRQAKVSTARNIKLTGRRRKLVRVTFDDGTHIDCTPDHKFQVFKWGNGKSAHKDWFSEASQLAKGQHVRALRFENPVGYPVATWGRRRRQVIHRMVAEWSLGRKLKKSEHVHHIDRDKTNFRPENLLVTLSAKDHARHHPEVASRMRDNNPTKNGVGQQWRDNLSRALTGIKRAEEAKERYRAAAIIREAKMRTETGKRKRWWTEPDGKTHLSYAPRSDKAVAGRKAGTWGRKWQFVNHRVVSVEPLEGLHDVYCMEVSDTGWFYANNVLVKNCSFCMINVFQHTNRYRMREPHKIIDEMWMLYQEHGVQTFKFTDELFVLNKKHTKAICELLIKTGLGAKISSWCYARPDTVDADELKMFRAAGFDWFALGIESGAESIRDGADKSMSQQDIKDVVHKIEAAGINVIANYIFGLPGETAETAAATVALAQELNTAFANFYSAMAYPGSKLYDEAKAQGWTLPATWAGYSQHNEHTHPLSTVHLSSADIVRLRDSAFQSYFTSRRYREAVAQRFGQGAAAHIEAMTSYKLKRNLLEAQP